MILGKCESNWATGKLTKNTFTSSFSVHYLEKAFVLSIKLEIIRVLFQAKISLLQQKRLSLCC